MVMLQVPSNQEVKIPYQDIWLGGQLILKGLRECESRYESIDEVCRQYQRPITVLDIGADMGYFSLRLAEKFLGTYVMIEADSETLNTLCLLCQCHGAPHLILLSKCMTLEDLHKLAEKEHFDVVLAMSIIHHFKEPAQEVLKALISLGTHLIFEPPSEQEVPLNLDLTAFGAKAIATCKSAFSPIERTTYLISSDAK